MEKNNTISLNIKRRHDNLTTTGVGVNGCVT